MTHYSKSQFIALHRLAAAHGHAWATDDYLRDALALADDEGIPYAALAPLSQRVREADTGPVSGIYVPPAPGEAHVTGSGRLRWYTQLGISDQIIIEVWRPGLVGGGVRIARATVNFRGGAVEDWYILPDYYDARAPHEEASEHVRPLVRSAIAAGLSREAAESMAADAVARATVMLTRHEVALTDAMASVGVPLGEARFAVERLEIPDRYVDAYEAEEPSVSARWLDFFDESRQPIALAADGGPEWADLVERYLDGEDVAAYVYPSVHRSQIRALDAPDPWDESEDDSEAAAS